MIKYVEKFILFLKFDLRLSGNTVQSYKNDLHNYIKYFSENTKIHSLDLISYDDIRKYIIFLTKQGYKPSSINRSISSIKKFHLYLLDNEITVGNPSDLIESQKNRRNFPDTLSVEEIENILNCIEGNSIIEIRDSAILSLLYSSGIRVSELINLQLSDIFLEEDYIKIIGKGNKERLVPIGGKAKKKLIYYIQKTRINLNKMSSK